MVGWNMVLQDRRPAGPDEVGCRGRQSDNLRREHLQQHLGSTLVRQLFRQWLAMGEADKSTQRYAGRPVLPARWRQQMVPG